MDPLSDVLKTIKLSGVVFLRAQLRDQYGVEMPPPTLSHPSLRPPTPDHRLVMFHIVREGQGYVEVEGFEPRQIRDGDLIIILDDLVHSVVDVPGRATVPSASIVAEFTKTAAPPEVNLGRGDVSMRLVCGMLQFVERGISPLFSALPPYLLIPQDEGPSTVWLKTSIAHLITEAESGRPGSETLLSRLTELIFVETIRTYIDRLPESERGWLAALKDPLVGAAVRHMHERPQHAWTVAELARRVGASRSAFSARFTELLEVSPITYLYRWRIRQATNLLDDTQLSIPEIAAQVGYESESAFSRAFKREMGSPPASWRRRFEQEAAEPV
ncbi:MAG: AraC family transcriptional regulator [Myxococcales bacterium]|nr:AraC family transcriptional regulator [Myxococcales bacterium]MDD9970016.1 AraC family transcriptional regulator [Myxococcales bacterium]